MKFFLNLAKRIDRLIAFIGQSVSWLVFTAVIITFAVVVMRYGFGFGRIWIQESYLWMHALIFMLGAAWTLQDEGHVRVDIFYRKFSPPTQCWVNLLGVILLLLPTCILILAYSTPYVVTSWQLMEGSRETGGIPAIFLLKTVIPVTALLLICQGVSMLIHHIARLRGLEPMPESPPNHTCVTTGEQS